LGAVPFRHPDLSTNSGAILSYEPQPALLCPDGQPARFYVVYNTSKTEETETIVVEDPVEDSGGDSGNGSDSGGDSGEDTGTTPPPNPDTHSSDTATPDDGEPVGPAGSPVAIVLHSSAFDYVLSPDPADPLAGEHYRGGVGAVTRLHRDWGIKKVWETLGQGDAVEPTEENTGSLPAAMIEAGMVGIYPINCWGDLWHNGVEDSPNDLAADLGVLRNGHTFAWWMVRFLQDLDFAVSHNSQVALNLDLDQLYLVGLGDGARGVADLLRREDMPPVAGVLLDAPVEDLTTWATHDSFGAERVGLQRLYNFDWEDPDDLERPEPTWSENSLHQLASDGGFQGVRTAVLYSDADPRIPLPENHYDSLVQAMSGVEGAWVQNTGESAHVFSNSDFSLSTELVNYLLTGEIPIEPEEATEDTGDPEAEPL
jgi:hypothetical protein